DRLLTRVYYPPPKENRTESCKTSIHPDRTLDRLPVRKLKRQRTTRSSNGLIGSAGEVGFPPPFDLRGGCVIKKISRSHPRSASAIARSLKRSRRSRGRFPFVLIGTPPLLAVMRGGGDYRLIPICSQLL